MELLTRLNDGILLATERGDLQRNREKWLPVFESYWLSRQNTRRWIGAVAAGLTFAAILSWLWYRSRLRAEHRLTEEIRAWWRRAPDELEQANARLRHSEESVRGLNLELEGRVAGRTAELAARVAEVERLNAELEAFAYSVSHDLRRRCATSPVLSNCSPGVRPAASTQRKAGVWPQWRARRDAWAR